MILLHRFPWQDIILMCWRILQFEKKFYIDFDFVLLSCHKRTKKSRLNRNFTHLYDSVKARKTRLANLGITS